MHRFWDPVFEHLHAQVVDELAQPTIHSAIFPLFHLNRYFRSLILKRMLAMLNEKPDLLYVHGELEILEPENGAFLKIHQAADTFDQGISLSVNDPRELFKLDPRDLFGLDYPLEMDLDDVEEGWGKRDSVTLYMSSFDPSTQTCTFKPASKAPDSLIYTISCDPDTGEEYDCCDGRPGSFQVASSAWFRPAKEGEYEWSHEGLVLAGRDGLQPARTAAMWPKAGEKRGESLKQPSLLCTLGWNADVVTKRLDAEPFTPTGEIEDCWVDVRLRVKKISVPLFDVFFPPITAKYDLDYDPDVMLLQEYLDEYYKKQGKSELMEEEVKACFLGEMFA